MHSRATEREVQQQRPLEQADALAERGRSDLGVPRVRAHVRDGAEMNALGDPACAGASVSG
jgi:hypothetical protein